MGFTKVFWLVLKFGGLFLSGIHLAKALRAFCGGHLQLQLLETLFLVLHVLVLWAP